MPIYQTKGHLTGTIPAESVALAQEYLTEDDMTQYVDESIRGAVDRVRWELSANGHDYVVEAITNRELTADELRVLAEWTSGQNSDGLGEGFEQQDFAWAIEGECGECGGCESGLSECEDGSMTSFDWQTNDSAFTRVA